ncbi:Glycine-rich protein family [Quillaja saponaria]|uniref:Glycine-rich protein family n=1 Tax=Quillaja saponaria TaxID=32244 RepID=A0AAD7LU28_QUISA|nr:Glycine-rich protein family [Quillaja saponaria]
MENYMRLLFLCFSLGIVILLGLAKAENKTEPRRNDNLSPFEAWRSAYFCLQNISHTCSTKDRINSTGLLDVPKSEIKDYCWGGCSQHTQAVLDCIRDVKRDFWFTNNATVSVINETINTACATMSDLSTLNYKSSATSIYKKLYTPFVSALPTLVLIFMLKP